MSELLSYHLRKIYFVLSSVIFLTMILLMMNQTSSAQSVNVVKENMPSIYLAYDSNVKVNTDDKKKSMEYVVLQLHNNTTVNINVSANFNTNLASSIENGKFDLGNGFQGTFLKSRSEVELCYDAEGMFVPKGNITYKKTKAPKVTDLKYSCSYRSDGKSIEEPHSVGWWIKPKEFIKFRVPSKLLRKNAKIYTEFSYPWEFKKNRLSRNEPKHRVYFYYFDLPTENGN